MTVPILGRQRGFEAAVKGRSQIAPEAAGLRSAWEEGQQGKSRAMRKEVRGGEGSKCGEHKV